MTNAITAHRIERLIRELSSDRHDVDPPDRDLYSTFMSTIERERLNLSRADAVRLEQLAERCTGVRK